MAITLPALAANVSTTTNPFGTNGGYKPTTTTAKPKVQKRVTLPKATTTGLSCDSLPRTCYAMTSCAQAQAAYKCGNTKLDRDKDGIPCDNLCQ